MPENRVEWGILGAGLAVLAVMGALIALSLGDDPQTGEPATTAAVVTKAVASPTPSAATVTATPVTTAPPAPPAAATPKPAAAPVTAAASLPRPRGVRLRLSATRADSWLEVRAGSAAGTVLFSGTLPRGETRTFRAGRLWVRFGGASNLDARLNGRALGLRFGTYDAFVTKTGLTVLGG